MSGAGYLEESYFATADYNIRGQPTIYVALDCTYVKSEGLWPSPLLNEAPSEESVLAKLIPSNG